MKNKSTYNWKNNLLGTKSTLYYKDTIIGNLESNNWNLDARVAIHSDQYHFKNKGIFNLYTEIRNQKDELIGDIEYNTWTNKATISLIDRKYIWCAKNMWMTAWQIEDENGQIVEIRPSTLTNGGEIESLENSELLLSVSLYLQKRLAAIFYLAVLIPIFLMLLH